MSFEKALYLQDYYEKSKELDRWNLIEVVSVISVAPHNGVIINKQ